MGRQVGKSGEPGLKMTTWRRKRISSQLVRLILLATLIPISILGYLGYRRFEEYVSNTVVNDLKSISIAKADRIGRYINEREVDAAVLARLPAVRRLFDRPHSPRPADRHFFEGFVADEGFDDLLLVTTGGNVAFSLQYNELAGANLRTGRFRSAELNSLINLAVTTLGTGVSDFTPHPETGEPAVFIAAPVLTPRGNVAGVVLVQLSNQALDRIALEFDELRKTGEIVIGGLVGNHIMLLTATRHDPNAAFRREVRLGSGNAIPIQLAVQGRQGYGRSVDYRGEKVIAVWRYVPSTRWGLVAKIDLAEVLAPIQAMRNSALAGILFTLGVVALATFLSARRLAAPLERLQTATDTIARGDYGNRVPVETANEIGRLAVSFNTMTEQLQASRNELQAQRQHLQDILDNTTAVVFIKDLQFRYTFINREHERLFHIPAAEIRGKTDFEIFPPTFAKKWAQSERVVLETGQPQQIDESAPLDSGLREFVVVKFPLRDALGRVYGLCGIATDITPRKQYERMREQWTSVIAHDLRQPITVIAAHAELLTMDLGEPHRRKAEHILKSAKSLNRMIADLMDMNAIETHHLVLEAKPVDVKTFLEGVVERNAPSAQGHAIALHVEDDLPPMEADAGRIEQVLDNLLTNAFKYGLEGSPICIHAARQNGAVAFSVENQGAGIAPDERGHLFDRFRRASSSSGTRGLGLGLYNAKGLVEAHGGKIWVESTPGQTTEFRFTVPVHTM